MDIVATYRSVWLGRMQGWILVYERVGRNSERFHGKFI